VCYEIKGKGVFKEGKFRLFKGRRRLPSTLVSVVCALGEELGDDQVQSALGKGES